MSFGFGFGGTGGGDGDGPTLRISTPAIAVGATGVVAQLSTNLSSPTFSEHTDVANISVASNGAVSLATGLASGETRTLNARVVGTYRGLPCQLDLAYTLTGTVDPSEPAMFPLSSLSQSCAEIWSSRKVVSGYAGSLFQFCKTPDSTAGGDLQAFGPGTDGLRPDAAAVEAWAGHKFPQVATIYGQLNGRNLTAQAATVRPYYNLHRGAQGDAPVLSFNIFSGPSLDTDGVKDTANTRMTIPAAVSVQRGNCSIAMVVDVPSNACTTAAIFGIGSANRLQAFHAANSYASNTGLRIVHSSGMVTNLKLKNGRQSVVITTGYGVGGANNATNYTRVSIDGETVYNLTGAITDATITGGEIGSDGSGNNIGQFALDLFAVFTGPLSAGDEALIHDFHHTAFGTRPPASCTHLLHYGSSTQQGYRSHNNGFAAQLARAVQAGGRNVVATGFGRSGVSIAQADNDAATVAGFKYAGAQKHVVIIHGGVNDLVSNYTEAQIDTNAEQDAAAAAIYASITSAVGKFRANTSVTGNPWRVVVMCQHKRDMGQISGQTANLVAYRYAVLDKLAALIKANAGGLAYTWIDPNDDAGIAAYPNTGSRDPDDIHLNEMTGLPALVVVAKPVIDAAIDAPEIPVVTPVSFSYTDTTATDDFSNTTGSIVATQSPTSYGITGGTGTTTITKVGTYGTLAVVAATGAYTYTPDDAAINAVEAGTPTDVFTITATNGAGTGTATLTVTVNSAVEGGGYSAEATALFAAMSTAPSTGLKDDIDACIVGLKADGVWSLIDALWVQQVEASDQFLNWKNPAAFVPSALGAPTFVANRGFDYDGVDDAHDLNYNPAAGGTLYTQNSNHGGVLVLVGAANANPIVGIKNGSTATATLNPRSATNTTIFRAQDNTGESPARSETVGTGLFVWNRSASNARQLYVDGAAVTLNSPTAASVALVNGSMRVGGTGGSSPGYAVGRVAATVFGGSMTALQHAALNTRLNTYSAARSAI